MWAATQTIERFIEEQTFVLEVARVVKWRANDGEFIFGENCMAKCIFTISLL